MKVDTKIRDVEVTDDDLVVDLMDGRRVSVPLAWYPRLLHATAEQRRNWQVSAAGYGLHWPDLDEDLSVEGMLRGAFAPEGRASQTSAHR